MDRHKPSGLPIIIACSLMMILSYAMYTAASLFTVSITSDLGFERAAFMINASIRGVATIICSLLFGYLINRFRVRWLVITGGILTVVVYFLFSISSTLWMFYIGGALCGIAFSFTNVTIISTIINSGFTERRGLILGIVNSASGLAGILINPIVGQLINSFGWRLAFCCIAGFSALVTLLVYILFRISLFEKSSSIQNQVIPQSAGNKENSTSMFGSLLLPFKLPKIRSMLIMTFILGISTGPAYYNVAPALQDMGFSIAFVSSVALTALAIGNFSGKLVIGSLSDRFGARTASFVSYIVTFIGMAIFTVLNNTGIAAAIIASGCIGMSVCVANLSIPVTVDYLYKNNYTSAMGTGMASYMLGSTIGSPVSNYMFDLFGNYSYAFLYQAVLVAVGLILCMHLLSSKTKPARNEMISEPM